MSKNISDNNNAAMSLMSHVGDVKYLNKRSKATVYKAMLLMLETSEIRITLCIIIQTIRIKKYFELML